MADARGKDRAWCRHRGLLERGRAVGLRQREGA